MDMSNIGSMVVKVVEFEMYNDKWNEMISKSKFKDMKGFGLAPKGKIALQDHGNQVWYRNIKIKRYNTRHCWNQ